MRRPPTRAVVIGVAFVVAGCGILDPPDAGLPIRDVQTSGRPMQGSLADNPTGPHVELMTATVGGQQLEVAAQGNGAGICLSLQRPSAGTNGLATSRARTVPWARRSAWC